MSTALLELNISFDLFHTLNVIISKLEQNIIYFFNFFFNLCWSYHNIIFITIYFAHKCNERLSTKVLFIFINNNNNKAVQVDVCWIILSEGFSHRSFKKEIKHKDIVVERNHGWERKIDKCMQITLSHFTLCGRTMSGKTKLKEKLNNFDVYLFFS